MYSVTFFHKMGGQQSGEIPKKSPLGCILNHWKDIGGSPGGTENRKTLIKYCNQWWPLYKLECEEKWPSNGTINYNTLLQLMLFLRREGKWDEVSYADMFFTLRNHPEWQKECGINLAPQDPLILAIEKDMRKEGAVLWFSPAGSRAPRGRSLALPLPLRDGGGEAGGWGLWVEMKIVIKTGRMVAIIIIIIIIMVLIIIMCTK